MKKTTKPCNSSRTITTARRTDNIPLICTSAGPIHPVHSQPMSLTTEAMPEMRLYFCHFPAVLCMYVCLHEYREVDFFFCSTSNSSCLLSSLNLKIGTGLKVGESTETAWGQLETLVYNKCFFFSESFLHEPFDNWGGYWGPEVLVSIRVLGWI